MILGPKDHRAQCKQPVLSKLRHLVQKYFNTKEGFSKAMTLSSILIQDAVSAASGIVVGMLSILGGIKGANRVARAAADALSRSELRRTKGSMRA